MEIRPFFLEPKRSFFRVHQIRFRVHYGQTITFVVLLGDNRITDHQFWQSGLQNRMTGNEINGARRFCIFPEPRRRKRYTDLLSSVFQNSDRQSRERRASVPNQFRYSFLRAMFFCCVRDADDRAFFSFIFSPLLLPIQSENSLKIFRFKSTDIADFIFRHEQHD